MVAVGACHTSTGSASFPKCCRCGRPFGTHAAVSWDFGIYLRQVFGNLWGTALLVNGTIGAVALFTGRRVVTRLSIGVLAILFVCANYQAWHSEYLRAESLTAASTGARRLSAFPRRSLVKVDRPDDAAAGGPARGRVR
jgi:hypothetical protein